MRDCGLSVFGTVFDLPLKLPTIVRKIGCADHGSEMFPFRDLLYLKFKKRALKKLCIFF